MRESEDNLATIIPHLLPGVRACAPGSMPYDPRYCLAIYCPSDESEQLQVAAVLAGESTASHGGQCCCLMEGIPQVAPPGAIILGTWEGIEKAAPHLLSALPKPQPQGYVLRLDRHALLVGSDFSAAFAAVQTFVQMLALSPQRELPACLINDQPALPRRSFMIDLTHAQPRITLFTRIIGLLQSFKANRLHILLNAVSPRPQRSALGVVSWEDAETLSGYSREYCLPVIPWADLAGQVANDELSPGAAWEIGRQMIEAFGAPAIGLGMTAIPCSAAEGVRELVARLAESQNTPLDIYLPFSAAAPCADLQRHGIRLVAGAFADDQGLLPNLAPQPNIPLAIWGTPGNRGFEPIAAGVACQRLDAILSAALTAGAEEAGYFCPGGGGKIWLNDIAFLISWVTAAWEGKAATSLTRRRFLRLAYGEQAVAVDEAGAAIAEAFPPELRGEDGAEMRRSIFGKNIAPELWQKIEAIDWTGHEKKMRTAEGILLACRKNLSRNSETLAVADIGLAAARCLANKVCLFKEALMHYRDAQEGRAGSLGRCRQCLERLFYAITPFFQRLRTIREDSGYAAGEAKSLEQWLMRLRDQVGMLSRLETAEKLPPPEEIGLPSQFQS